MAMKTAMIVAKAMAMVMSGILNVNGSAIGYTHILIATVMVTVSVQLQLPMYSPIRVGSSLSTAMVASPIRQKLAM